MTSQLNKQFNTLALIDEIDRSILSSLDSSVIIPRSLRMISEFFSSRLVILAHRTPEELDRTRLTILEGNHHNDIDEEYVQLNEEDQKKLFSGERFKILQPDTSLPHFLAKRKTSNSFLFLPLNTERHVIGVPGLARSLGIADLVRFEPPVGRATLAAYYRAADLTVVPSYSESFGLVALESQACGTPGGGRERRRIVDGGR